MKSKFKVNTFYDRLRVILFNFIILLISVSKYQF